MCDRHTWFLRLVAVLVLVGATGLWTATEAQAQQVLLAYSAKFVCGTRTLDAPGGSDVVRGRYSTTINIHNPHFTPVNFRKKAVIARSQRDDLGRISPFVGETLPPDGALGVDCPDIRALFGAGVVLPLHIEGFVVIYSQVELDVVGKYTARHRPTPGAADTGPFDVESIDIEAVTPKRITVP